MIPELQIPASELRQRIANKQIRLNDEAIDLLTYRQLDLESAMDLGEWLFQTYHLRNETISGLLKIYEPEIWADNNSPKLMEYFKGKAILRISKQRYNGTFIIDYDRSTKTAEINRY